MTFTFAPAPPKEAYQFWKDKVPMSMKEFNRLAEDERVKAFIVGGVARADMLSALYRSIDRAIATGQAREAWKEDIAALFKRNGWTALQPWRLDNIFRTNIQTAYNVGRYKQLTDVVEDRPYWRYSAVNDSRTRLAHAALHGRVVRADDPFWDKFYPPNGFRCRCTVSCLSESDMARKGYNAETITPGQPLEITMGNHPHKGRVVPVMPDDHFQTNPGKEYWQADTGRYRADVRQALLKDISRACPEDFCGACEFAETDCYKRLKRHLSQEDLEDLQTVVWAEGETVKQGFGEWVDTVLKTMKPKGEIHPVGTLPAKVLRALETQPRLALVTMDDKQLVHMARAVKTMRGAALTADEIKDLAEQLNAGRWWRDTENSNLLVTWVRSGDIWLKAVINVDYRIDNSRKRIANHVITAGVVKSEDIEDVKKYEEL